MNILGISAFYHDSAACLVRDGRVAAAVQEERFSRKKHDDGFPHRAISYCLESQGLSIRDIDLVAFYEKPFLKFERILETYLAFAPSGLRSFLHALPLWISRKIWMKEVMRKELGYDGTFLFPEHHESHAASAFFPSPFDEAAFLTIDGVGEWTTTSYGTGEGNRVGILADIGFPHSLGLLYSAFTYYTGFKVNSAEYKVMGLAPYGEPRYRDMILERLIDLKEDGSYRLNMDYFDYCTGLTMTNHAFHELFGGPPRTPGGPLLQRHMDLARSVQEVTEEAVIRMARYIRRETGMDRLCLAGGVALNCVANGKLLRSGIYEDIWIQPASGDAGGALGAALLAHYHYGGAPRSSGAGDILSGSFLGPSFSDDLILSFFRQNRIPHERLEETDLLGRVSDLIAAEKVVGWFQGRMEYGPRALGCRSILGDARSPRMQERINMKIKFREGFRPFAPAVLAEHASSFFELDRPSPYMLLVANVREEHRLDPGPGTGSPTGLDRLKLQRSDIPAVTHVDYSARIQTVHRETNPLFHDLLEAFYNRHGCPVMVNTSFNVRGEPMVCTPEDAYRCFMRTDMDYLAIGHFLLDKSLQRPLPEGMRRPLEFEPD